MSPNSGLWLTAAQVALAYGVSRKYVRKLAHKLRWDRIRVGQEVAYRADHVDAWFDRPGR